MNRDLRLPSPSFIVALVAMFVALSSGAAAGTVLASMHGHARRSLVGGAAERHLIQLSAPRPPLGARRNRNVTGPRNGPPSIDVVGALRLNQAVLRVGGSFFEMKRPPERPLHSRPVRVA